MPQTYKDYSVREIAIYLGNKTLGADSVERVQEGDIIAIRAPHDGIGLQEAAQFMWLRIEGLEQDDIDELTEPWTEPLEPTEVEDISGIVKMIAKRRYCIPLRRLKQLEPRLNVTRARNRFDEHQPFLCHDQDTYLYLTSMSAFDVHGLVWDKARMRYL